MKSAKTIYDQLTGDREGFLEQARMSSRLTIPSLIPPDGTTKYHQQLYKPFQGIGAFGVNALANKLVLALFPAQEPFFRFTVNLDQEDMESVPPDQLAEIDNRLVNAEQTILQRFTTRGDRSAVVETIKHLLVGGSALLHVGAKGTTTYPLDRFVVERDGNGRVLRIICVDYYKYETFKEEYGDLGDVPKAHKGNRHYTPSDIEVYTHVWLEDGEWRSQEEAAGKVIPGSQARYPLDKPAYLALRLNRIDGQAYGRGYIEDLYGDLRSMEELSRALVEGSAASAKTVYLVNPNGLTNQRTLSKARNGDFIPGSEQDVTTLKTNKNGDLAVAAGEVQRIEARLNQAFMLNSSVQRNAERVTASEIQMMAGELEQILGGVYTLLAEEFQKPYITRLIEIFTREGAIPNLPSDIVEPTIVTGLSALGRGVDKTRLMSFFTEVSQALGAEAFAQYVNVPSAIAKLASASGLDPRGIIKDPQQLAQEQAEAQQAQLTQQLGPSAIGGLTQLAKEGINKDGTTSNSQDSPIQEV